MQPWLWLSINHIQPPSTPNQWCVGYAASEIEQRTRSHCPSASMIYLFKMLNVQSYMEVSWGFHKLGYPNSWMVYMEKPIQKDVFCREHPYFGNPPLNYIWWVSPDRWTTDPPGDTLQRKRLSLLRRKALHLRIRARGAGDVTKASTHHGQMDNPWSWREENCRNWSYLLYVFIMILEKFGGFLKWGYPKSSMFRWIFNQPSSYLGTPMTMETPISRLCKEIIVVKYPKLHNSQRSKDQTDMVRCVGFSGMYVVSESLKHISLRNSQIKGKKHQCLGLGVSKVLKLNEFIPISVNMNGNIWQ